MANFSQQNRLLAIDTPLGADTLLMTRLKGEEAVSSLFEFEVEAYSLRKSISPAEIVGKNVTVRITRADDMGFMTPGSYRYINGYVKSFRQEGRHLQDLRAYTAVIVPWFWFLTQTSDCKVFQFKTVKEIASSIFSENGFTDFQFRLVGSHPVREYCVQYKETDFQFLSRLFEEEGIFYYFEHQAGKHVLVLSDHVGGYGQCGEAAVEYRAGTISAHSIHAWHHNYLYRTGKQSRRDYDFKKPRDRLQTGETASMKVPGTTKYEHFEYPGRYEEKGLGDTLTRLRVEADEAAHDVVYGHSGCRTFTSGHRFTLKRHDDAPEEMAEYVLLGVEHDAQDYSHTINDEDEKSYSNSFHCIPASTVYRPPLLTGWPQMQGPQNAMVVGPPGEEIYTDEYGRVKIQFPWDRYGKYNENSSCWVRVSHNWAGKNWGGIFLPRIGQEVIVDFMDGDPDRPLITGRVYNADQMPPWSLPANKTQSGILTRSSKGGSAANANWIRFEDKKGEEQLFIHAEKNQDIEVENDETHWVGHDRTKTIDNDETVHVKHDRTETVDNNETITIGNNRSEKVLNNEDITVANNRTENVGSTEQVSIGGNRMHTTGISEIKTVGMVRVHSVGVNETNTVGVAQQNTIGMVQTNNVGQKMTYDVGEEIIIRTGKSVIHMLSDGTITIKGVNITIEADNELNTKTNSDTNIKAGGLLTMKAKKILEN